MIFLSAQPDEFYFLWQLELQIVNFEKFGIRKESIHILIAYHGRVGLRSHFQNFIEEFDSRASIFVYEDTRESREYESSVRPHIIAKHWKKFPELSNAKVLYHDSDILFRRLPKLFNHSISQWHISDTRSYLNISSLRSADYPNLLESLCSLVDIEVDTVIKLNENAGGAQYLIDRSSYGFWKNVEKDCENIFKELCWNTNEKIYTLKSSTLVNPWYSDMWAVLWNAERYGYKPVIHQELNFCWVDDPIENWEKTNILHYTGEIDNSDYKTFKKGRYTQFKPYFDENINLIDPKSCSSVVRSTINEHLNQLNQRRQALSDTVVIIRVTCENKSWYHGVLTQAKYLAKDFDIRIYMYTDFSATTNDEKGPRPKLFKFEYFGYDCKMKASIVSPLNCDKLIILNANIVINWRALISQIDKTNDEKEIEDYYPERMFNVDILFSAAFSKILNYNLLDLNRTKFKSIPNLPAVRLIRMNNGNIDECELYDLVSKKAATNQKILKHTGFFLN